MSTRKRVTPTFKELREDLKTMTFREKVDHLWTYYKAWLIGVFLVAVVLSATISGIINNSKEVLVSGMLANVSISAEGKAYLEEDYFQKVGGTAGQTVELFTTNFESMADPTSSEDNYMAAQGMIGRVSAGLLDYALLDELALEFYITQAMFLDLTDFFTADELAQLAQKDMLIYALEGDMDGEGKYIEGSADTEDRFPVAVKLKDTPFAQEALYGKDIYFIVGGNDPDLEAVRTVWEHILAWEDR